MMEADRCENEDVALSVVPPTSLHTPAPPAKKRPSRVRSFVFGCVFWFGMALIGILAVPTGILFGVIYLIAQGINFLTDKIADDP